MILKDVSPFSWKQLRGMQGEGRRNSIIKQDRWSQAQWFMPVIPVTQEMEVGRSESEAGLAKAQDPIWKTDQKQKDWECSSGDKALDWGPEFNHQYHKKKKKRWEWLLRREGHLG
jgi:hypothetical protein